MKKKAKKREKPIKSSNKTESSKTLTAISETDMGDWFSTQERLNPKSEHKVGNLFYMTQNSDIGDTRYW